MEWSILIVIIVAYFGNFFLISQEFLKEERPRTSFTFEENSVNRMPAEQMLEYVQMLQKLQHEKVNWKTEGF
jgi:hypothetical protein